MCILVPYFIVRVERGNHGEAALPLAAQIRG